MTGAAALRVGWCPGALRPMVGGDGLILRVKPRGAALTVEQALGIAAAAVRHGNGLLDLTARANLQIRGAAEASLPALQAALDALGLLDRDAGAEGRRNVLVAPLAGLDPSAAFDVRPAAAALEGALAAAADLAALPSKFGFAIADGGAVDLGDAPADVRFDAVAGGRFAVRLDGEAAAVAACAAGALPDTALRFAGVFVEASARDPSLRRMRDLVGAIGADAVAGRAAPAGAGPASPFPPRRAPSTASGSGERADRAPTTSGPPAGLVPLGPAFALAAAAPFGRLDAAQLDLLARGAGRAGARELRVAPWRALLAPGLARAAAERLAADWAEAGLIVDPLDPRLRVAACAGAPGCRRGTAPTLEHAARFARLVRPGGGIALHVSGCAKGCAHPGPAPLTLVAEGGRYALVVDGAPGGSPAATGLDPDEARRLLKDALRLERAP